MYVGYSVGALFSFCGEGALLIVAGVRGIDGCGEEKGLPFQAV